MPISFIPFALHQTTGDVEAVKEKTSLAEQMWMMWSGTYWADEINTPLLIIHATGDEKVSVAQADKLTEVLEQAGKTYEYITFDGNSHGEIRPEDGEKIKAFLEGQEQEEDSEKNNVK